jgi:hypothetical protein
MFDLLRGPHATLVGFGAHWQPLIEACARKFAGSLQSYVITAEADDPAHYVDAEGHARAAYGAGSLYVIRPDNYVGMATDDPASAPVLEYLEAFCPPGQV